MRLRSLSPTASKTETPPRRTSTDNAAIHRAIAAGTGVEVFEIPPLCAHPDGRTNRRARSSLPVLINKHRLLAQFCHHWMSSQVEDMGQFSQRLLEFAVAVVHPEIDDAAAALAAKAIPVLADLVDTEAGHLIIVKGAVSTSRG